MKNELAKFAKGAKPMSFCVRCKTFVDKDGMHYHDVCKDCLTDVEKAREERRIANEKQRHELYLRRLGERKKVKNNRNFKKGRKP